MLENITIEMVYGFMIVVLAVLEGYNLLATARKNAREEKKRMNEPTENLEEMIKNMNKKLDNDKRRLDEHDERLSDLQKGLMAICAGVQALIGHEMHNGNTDEMEEAQKNLYKWLRERP